MEDFKIPQPTIAFSVVVPAYEAADEVANTVARLRNELAAGTPDAFELIVVDDGSADRTADVAEQAGADQVIRQRPNRGKGAAVRAGMAASRGEWVVFTDVDLSYSPAQVLQILDALHGDADVAIGARRFPGSESGGRQGVLRELSGRMFNLLTRGAVHGGYRDTQCGLKGMRTDLAKKYAESGRIDGFAFDVELLHMAERAGAKIVEIPVEMTERPGSRVRMMKHVPEMVRDVLKIRLADRRS